MAQQNVPPLAEFEALIKTDALLTIKANDILQGEIGKSEFCKQFLSIQARMLLSHEFHEVTITSRQLSGGGVGRYIQKTLDDDGHTITPASLQMSSSGRTSLSATLAHEMVHGIEDLKGCMSEAKVREQLDKMPSDPPSIKDKLVLMSSVLPEEIQGQFRNQARQNTAAKTYDKASQELGAYVIEGMFREGGNSIAFHSRFEALVPNDTDAPHIQSAKKLVQQAVAISVYEVNSKMIKYIEQSPDPQDQKLLPHLKRAEAAEALVSLSQGLSRDETSVVEGFVRKVMQESLREAARLESPTISRRAAERPITRTSSKLHPT
jgi:hypothetical protein